ncbi:hypothetical protein [Evansella tamaricis]|uniref:Uncharacterized protein n=1 Tax=Evansella tamaricis TaxID=2069301 RepID=A0ABS6JIX0_9BACI|nr:hypothetical protein [Evansella tamaricis]MBU9713340.1 hypothetical protein [Evansella tamaricis]
MITALAIYFFVVAAIVTGFQISLALGAPLGAFTLGGKFPGKLPKKMRFAAIIQILILLLFTYFVALKADIISTHPDYIGVIGIWIVTVFFLFGSIVNVSSPSKPERLLWGPINVLTFVACLLIALF